MAKKSLKERIFFLEKLEVKRKNLNSNLSRKCEVSKTNVNYLVSGFASKQEFMEASKEGFNSLRDFRRETRFRIYDEYKQMKAAGFSTKEEWKIAGSKGFLDKEEFILAQKEGFDEKKLLLDFLTKELEEYRIEQLHLEKEIRYYKESISSVYNKESLINYKENLLEKRKELELRVFVHEKYSVVKDEESSVSIAVYENKRLKLLETINTLLHWVETRFPYLEKWQKILNILNKFRHNVPVQMSRISELTELTEEETEAILKDIETELPLQGEYLELEQVFITQNPNKSKTAIISSERRLTQQKKKMKRIHSCINCGEKIENTNRNFVDKCPSCDAQIPECMICRGHIFQNDEVLIESNCGSMFHRKHILEWVNVQGKCPICRTRINVKSLRMPE